MSDYDIVQSIFNEESDDELDSVEGENIYDSDLDEEFEVHPEELQMNSSTDSEEEDVAPRRRKITKQAGGRPKKRKHLPPIIASASPPAATSAATPDSCQRQPVHRDDLLVNFDTATVKSASGYVWHTRPQVAATTRTPARNLLPSFTPGPTQTASQSKTPVECFKLFVTDALVDMIVQFTNQKIEVVARQYQRQTATVQPTNAAEIRALIGILVFSGYRKDNHLNTKELWCKVAGATFYKAAMSEARFNFLLFCLRFDDVTTREERRTTDKFAPIRDVWDTFMTHCEENYTPHENLTVDEQLLAFRGKCPFRMYIQNKPAKYGIKIVMVNDVASKYMLKGIPYLGKHGTTPRLGLQLGHQFTKDLTQAYRNTNRNITTDNWFTSVPLLQDMLSQGMTLVGTVRANKREIPECIRKKDARTPGSSAFLYTKDMTLVSHLPKTKAAKKNVLLLSSMHTQGNVNPVSGKPEIVEYYNETKGGVDTFDQMCATYSCSRKTNRWPMCVFYGILNMSVINSWIIYSSNNNDTDRAIRNQRKYMHDLALELIKPSAYERMMTPTQHRLVKNAIRQVCSISIPHGAALSTAPSAAEQKQPPKRCRKCDTKADKKTRFRCYVCQDHVCMNHYIPICYDCV